MDVLCIKIFAVDNGPENLRNATKWIDAVAMHECIVEFLCAGFKRELFLGIFILFVCVAFPRGGSLIVHGITFFVDDLDPILNLLHIIRVQLVFIFVLVVIGRFVLVVFVHFIILMIVLAFTHDDFHDARLTRKASDRAHAMQFLVIIIAGVLFFIL